MVARGYRLDEMLGTPTEDGFFSAEQVDALALAIDNVAQGKPGQCRDDGREP